MSSDLGHHTGARRSPELLVSFQTLRKAARKCPGLTSPFVFLLVGLPSAHHPLQETRLQTPKPPIQSTSDAIVFSIRDPDISWVVIHVHQPLASWFPMKKLIPRKANLIDFSPRPGGPSTGRSSWGVLGGSPAEPARGAACAPGTCEWPWVRLKKLKFKKMDRDRTIYLICSYFDFFLKATRKILWIGCTGT